MDNNVFVQYADVFIPIVVSIISGIITFHVLKEKVKRLEIDVKEIRVETKEIRDKAIACETSLKEREPLTKKKSPISLTDRGNKILNESGGEKFVDDNYSELKKKLDQHNTKTAYDIQESSKQVIEEYKTDTKINPLKEYLYKEGLEWDELSVVLGIYLRDKALPDFGFTTDDVDKTTPK